MEKFNAGWFVMYTKPRHEKAIVKQLDDLSIDNYLPIIKKLRIWSDRKKYIESPLFPSYVFVRLNDVKSYFKSLEVTGVLHYVRTGKHIASVKDSVINHLKLITSQAQQDIEVSSEFIYPGSMLYIKEGPFVGFECEVIQHKDKQKIIVRIELLQRNILIDMPAQYLMAI